MNLNFFRPSTAAGHQDADFRTYAAHGDAEAFRRLVERHLPTVQGPAARVLGTGSPWIDDVAQDVFLQLALKARQLPPDTIVCAWLHRQAARRAIDIIRSESRRRKREAAADLSAPAEPDTTWNAIAPRLDRELLRLPRQDQEVLALRFMERCSSEEAARRLGLSSAAVRKRIERALDRLRERLTGPVPGTLTVTALSAYLSVPTAEAMPAAKVSAITAHCLATPAAPALLSLPTITLMTKTQILCTTGAAITLGAGIFIAVHSSHSGTAETGATAPLHSSALPVADARSTRSDAERKSSGSEKFPDTKEGRMAMLRNILYDIDTVKRTQALDRFLARLDTKEFAEMTEYLCSLRPGSEAEKQTFLAAQGMMLSAWTKRDPLDAVKAANRHPHAYKGFMNREAEQQMVAGIWAAQDPVAAIAWIKSCSGYPGPFMVEGPFMVGLVRTVVGQDIGKATALLLEIPPSDFRNEVLTGMMPGLFAKGMDAAIDWVDRLEDKGLAASANNIVAEKMAETDPRAAADWIFDRIGKDAENTSIGPVMTRWLAANREDALACFDGLPEGRVRRDAYEAISERFRYDVTGENAKWVVTNVGDGELPKGANGWVFGYWMRSDPETALNHWQKMPPQEAMGSSGHVVDSLAKTDVLAASEFYFSNLNRVNPYAAAEMLQRMNPQAATAFVEEAAQADPDRFPVLLEKWVAADAEQAKAYCAEKGLEVPKTQLSIPPLR